MSFSPPRMANDRTRKFGRNITHVFSQKRCLTECPQSILPIMFGNHFRLLFVVLFAITSASGCLRGIPRTVKTNLENIEQAQKKHYANSGGKYESLAKLIGAGLLETRYLDCYEKYCYSIMTTGQDFTAFATPAVRVSEKTTIFTIHSDGK